MQGVLDSYLMLDLKRAETLGGVLVIKVFLNSFSLFLRQLSRSKVLKASIKKDYKCIID